MIGRKLAGAAAMLLILGLGVGAPALADAPAEDKPDSSDTSLPDAPVPGGFGSWRELIEVQNGLSAVAEKLEGATEQATGFTGIELMPERRSILLHWQGPIPDQVQKVVDDLRGQATIDIPAARHSLATLLEQAKPIAVEGGVQGVTPNVDGSGLTVEFAGSVEEAQKLPSIQAAQVPVTILPFERWNELGCTGRKDDCSPYWGGARWSGPSTSFCSSGFAVLHNGVSKMLSAAHCGANGQVVKDGGGETMGTIQLDNNARDTLLISNAPLSSAGRIYSGPWNAGLASNRKVAGATSAYVGGYVCTSGAATGWHCNIKITAVNAVINSTSGALFPMVRAKQIFGSVAAGKGDSGGPVVFLNSNGSVNGKGTISTGKNAVACPAGSPSSACFSEIGFAPLTKTLAYYEALPGSTISLLTTP